MRRATIVSLAVCCGVTAFVWALIAQTPSGRIVLPATGGGMGFTETMPEDVDGMRELLKREPGNGWGWMRLATILRDQDRADDAREAWQKAAETSFEQRAQEPQRTRSFFVEAWAEYQLGNINHAQVLAYHAEEVYRSVDPARLSRNDGMNYRLGWLRAIQGRTEQARSAWQDAARIIEVQPAADRLPDAWYRLAGYRALTGNIAGGLDALNKACDRGYQNAAHALHDEALEPIRGEPEFERMVLKMRANAAKKAQTAGG